MGRWRERVGWVKWVGDMGGWEAILAGRMVDG